MAAKKITLGTSVTYISTKGHQKLAFVTATPETVTPGHSLPELEEGQLHLLVVSPNGNTYPRFSVPSEATALAKGVEEADEDGNVPEPRGFWK